jgi:hypothetical protein
MARTASRGVPGKAGSSPGRGGGGLEMIKLEIGIFLLPASACARPAAARTVSGEAYRNTHCMLSTS